MAFETLMDKVNAFDGAFALWWLGQMGYIVRAGKLTLLLDAYLTDDPARRIPPLLSPAQLRGVDFVFGSHDHLDHIDDCAWRRIADVSPKTRFIVPALLADKIAARL
ncbi:MAG: hypothetical protein RSD95_15185, partial [Clostridia bacterium]